MRKAVDHGEFQLFYQPQIEIQTGRIIAAEALLRWEHPTRGIISPGDFISIAEDSGLIISITEWVMQTACEQNKAWQEAGLRQIRVSINLSGQHFSHQKIDKMADRILKTSGLNPHYLEVELTESTLMESKEYASFILRQLKDLGLSIAIDDFGTGYSSLAYLKTFPIDTLKIDRSFVRDLTSDSNDAAITKAVIAMAHSLDLKVIAEGVETNEQLAILRKLGCNEFQGFLFSEPLPPENFALLLQKDEKMEFGQSPFLLSPEKSDRN